MIIKELEMVNFRSHKSTKLSFDRGITLIVGENGAGKTSILEAINFALFKEKPEHLKIDELIMHGESEMKVSLRFIANGREYKVIRARERGKSEDALYETENGRQKIICRSEREVTREIERILRINSKVFLNAIYIRQGEIDKLLFLSPADKKEYLSKILGISDIELAWNNMRDIISIYELKKAELENVEEEIKKAESELENEKAELEKTEKELEKTEEKINAISKEKNEAEEKLAMLKRLKELKNKKEKLSLEIKHAEENLKKIEENEKLARENKGAYEKYREIEKQIEELRKASDSLSREAGAYENLKKSLDKLLEELDEREKEIVKKTTKIKNLLKICHAPHEILSYELRSKAQISEFKSKVRDEIEKSEGELEKIEDEINALSQEKGMVKSMIESLLDSIKALEKAESNCPICGRELTEKHRKELLENYTMELAENRKNLEEIKVSEAKGKERRREIENRLKILKDLGIESIESDFNEKERLEKKIEELKSELKEKAKAKENFEKVSKKIQEIKKEKEKIEDARNKYISALKFLEREKNRKQAYVEKIMAGREEVERIKEEISKFIDESKIDSELAKAEDEIRRITNELISYEKLRSRNEAIIREKEKNMKAYMKRIEDLKEKKKEREKLARFIDFLRKIREIFDRDNLQRELRARAMPVIEMHAKEIFESFEFPFTDLRIDDDFNIFVYSNRGEERAEMLSGGQKIALAIAIRIALSKALLSDESSLAMLETFLLDEPTVHLDEVRKRELVEVIKKLNYIPQSIIVTHDREFESSADRIIVVEKKNGVSVLK